MMIKSHKPCGAVMFSALAILMLAITPLAPASAMMVLSICGGDGVNRTISVPMDPNQQEPDNCVKGCHGFCSRKQTPERGDEADD
ncbi:MAG: hypothetical protein V7676_10170 [Parasphingorhabdus sp.]|uniref:hypothetical protein n=1 Tax=Parasphingorhabdus sp. TaxID=2709688 RepID=UPI003002684A